MVTGDNVDAESKGATKRKGSAVNRRKSSAAADVPAAIVEAHELSVADRRLAELGYVQVGAPPRLLWCNCIMLT